MTQTVTETDNIVPLKVESPVQKMMTLLASAGRSNFVETGTWEAGMCALVLALHPKCKAYEVIEALPAREGALDHLDVLNIMAHLGYVGQRAECRINKLDGRLLPALYHDEQMPPIVILSRNEDGTFRVYDTDLRIITQMSFSDHADGDLWIFQRYNEAGHATSRFMREAAGKSWFRALMGRFRGTFAQVLTAGFIMNLLALATPLFIMAVYDRVIAAGMPSVLPMLVVGAALAITFEWTLRRIRSRGLSWLAGRMDNIVGNKILAHLIGLSPSLIERASVSSQISRIKTFESVRDFFSGSIFLSLLEMPFVLIAAVTIWMIAGPLVFVPLAMAGLYAGLFYIVQRKVKVAILKAAKASSARQSFTIETFEKLRAIRCYGLGDLWQKRYRDLSGKEMAAHFHLNWLGMVAETGAHALTILSAVATVGFGVHLIWGGVMSTGALVAAMILTWRVLMPFYSLCTMIPRLEQLRNSIQQVNKLMNIDTEAVEARAYARLPAMQGRITAQQVGMRYKDGEDKVLSGLDFEARAGDLIALTGENGAGKSTLLKLVQGLYRTSEGSLRIDGFDIRQLDAPDLRRHIAYIPQHPDFFHGTIAENLRISNPLASEEEIEHALIHADAWEDIRAMPEGLETPIGTDKLPASLATRLSLARAYLHPAKILLIDELPNNFLGSHAGKNLKDYLAQGKGQRTCIITTYREDFMKLADSIILLRHGETPLVGSREEMLEIFYEENAA